MYGATCMEAMSLEISDFFASLYTMDLEVKFTGLAQNLQVDPAV
jgi:hypothetical protein